jgi:hypothetical protein
MHPLLRALLKSVRRDLAGYGSLKTNNFFLFVALMIWGALVSGVEPIASYPFLVALGLLMILPASGDPLQKIPGVRLGLWPLTRATRLTLRIFSLVLNPALWILAALIALRSGATIAAGFVALILAARLPERRRTDDRLLSFVRRSLASVVGDRTGHTLRWPVLLTNNVRQMCCVLDTWLALSIGWGSGAWRFLARHPDPEAYPILGLLAALALSTYTQCLFALDGEAGATRYRLLPVRGWRIVLAKDAAFLGVLLIAILPLSIPRGLTFGLTALALGRYPAMRLRLPLERWRFTSGRVLWGVLQGIAGIALPLFVAAPLYLVSLWWAGREWDRCNRLA